MRKLKLKKHLQSNHTLVVLPCRMVRTKYTISQLSYGWSKWGGGNKGLVRENPDVWYCQGCTDLQRKELPSYNVESSPREFVRVCAKCKHAMIANKIRSYLKLIGLVYDKRGQDNINLSFST